MDMEPFESPKLLLDGAKESIHEFEVACGAFIQSEPYRIVEEIDPQTGGKLVKLRFEGGFPSKMRLAAYHVVNDLRNALDQALCDGAQTLGLADVSHVHFPMGKDRDDFDREIRRRTKGIDGALIAYVTQLDVHAGGNSELWALGRMAGPNKHRRVLAISRGASGMSILSDARGMAIRGSVTFGREWNSARNELTIMRLGAGAAVTNMQLAISPEVVLGAVEVFGDQPATGAFYKLAGMVEGIILGIEAETARILRERSA
jgi:hypothetical protein